MDKPYIKHMAFAVKDAQGKTKSVITTEEQI